MEQPTAPRHARILIIEDDVKLRDLVVRSLEQSGFSAVAVGDGAHALAAVRRETPDLILLDLDLPSLNGLEVCRRIKADPDHASIPIVFMTAQAGEVDRIVGLELGADDYIAKPFSLRELTLRVHAVLRRTQAAPAGARVFGALSVDLATREVAVAGSRVTLTAMEFDLLAALIQARGRPLSRDRLLREVWGYEHANEVQSRTVDVHIRRLRRKLEPESHRLETLKHVGYRFAAALR